MEIDHFLRGWKPHPSTPHSDSYPPSCWQRRDRQRRYTAHAQATQKIQDMHSWHTRYKTYKGDTKETRHAQVLHKIQDSHGRHNRYKTCTGDTKDTRHTGHTQDIHKRITRDNTYTGESQDTRHIRCHTRYTSFTSCKTRDKTQDINRPHTRHKVYTGDSQDTRHTQVNYRTWDIHRQHTRYKTQDVHRLSPILFKLFPEKSMQQTLHTSISICGMLTSC